VTPEETLPAADLLLGLELLLAAGPERRDSFDAGLAVLGVLPEAGHRIFRKA